MGGRIAEPVRFAMIGGGEGAFIGAIHRAAAAMDGDWRLSSGAFSADTDRNLRSGRALGLSSARVYGSFETLLCGERALPEHERVEAVAIVTPNHLHAAMSIRALEAGFHVLCEKPMAMDIVEAEAIAACVAETGRRYALAFTYAGYAMIAEARARVAAGALGRIRLVQVEYAQGWLSRPVDREGNRQAEWRTDPKRAGRAGCLGDIGTHALHLAELVSGLRIEHLCAELSTHVAGRALDDDVSALLRFSNGARGVLKASQVAAGEENGLTIRIHGELGGLEWRQQEPNSLVLRWLDRPTEIVRAGGPGLGASAVAMLRTPAGHPEGYIEAFANVYRALALAIRTGDESAPGFSGVEDGLRSTRLVEAMLANAASGEKWTAVP